MTFDLFADGIAATSARAAIGFILALVLFKIAKKRFLRGGTPLDTLLVVIVGAVLGRGIVEGEHFVSALAGSATVVALHYALAALAYFAPTLSGLIEGHPRQLISNGQPDRREMRAALISLEDIREASRLQGWFGEDVAILEARQERNGEISVVLGKTDGSPSPDLARKVELPT